MSLAETLAPIWAELSSIKKRLPSVSPATVTSVGPVRIQVDGQAAPVAASPDSLVPVGPGDRVRVLRYGTTHLIVGRINPRGTPYAQAAGTVEITMNGTAATVLVPFPPGRFTVRPIITWGRSHNGASSAAAIVGVLPHSSPHEFTIGGYGTYTGTITVWWHAVQMTPTSADG